MLLYCVCVCDSCTSLHNAHIMLFHSTRCKTLIITPSSSPSATTTSHHHYNNIPPPSQSPPPRLQHHSTLTTPSGCPEAVIQHGLQQRGFRLAVRLLLLFLQTGRGGEEGVEEGVALALQAIKMQLNEVRAGYVGIVFLFVCCCFLVCVLGRYGVKVDLCCFYHTHPCTTICVHIPMYLYPPTPPHTIVYISPHNTHTHYAQHTHISPDTHHTHHTTHPRPRLQLLLALLQHLRSTVMSHSMLSSGGGALGTWLGGDTSPTSRVRLIEGVIMGMVVVVVVLICVCVVCICVVCICVVCICVVCICVVFIVCMWMCMILFVYVCMYVDVYDVVCVCVCVFVGLFVCSGGGKYIARTHHPTPHLPSHHPLLSSPSSSIRFCTPPYHPTGFADIVHLLFAGTTTEPMLLSVDDVLAYVQPVQVENALKQEVQFLGHLQHCHTTIYR